MLVFFASRTIFAWLVPFLLMFAGSFPLEAHAQWWKWIDDLADVSPTGRPSYLRERFTHRSLKDRASDAFTTLPSGHGSVGIYVGSQEGGTLGVVSATGTSWTISLADSGSGAIRKIISDLRATHADGNSGHVQIFVEDEVFYRQRKEFDGLSNDQNKLKLVREDGSVLKTSTINTLDGRETVVDFTPGLSFGGSSLKELDDVLLLLRAPFNKADVKVVSLFDPDDVDSTRAFSRAAGEFHVSFDELWPGGALPDFGPLRGKIVFVVGHVEDGYFVVKRADNTVVARYAIRDLERAADANNVTLINLGCDTATFSKHTGTATPVRDYVVAEGLERALRTSDYGSMLSALGGATTPLIVRSTLTDQARFILEAVARTKQRESVSQAVNSLRLNMPIRVLSQTASRIFPALPLWLTIMIAWYVGLYFLSIFAVRTGWRNFVGWWPIATAFRRGEWFRALLERLIRGPAFIIALPFFALYDWLIRLVGLAYPYVTIVFSLADNPHEVSVLGFWSYFALILWALVRFNITWLRFADLWPLPTAIFRHRPFMLPCIRALRYALFLLIAPCLNLFFIVHDMRQASNRVAMLKTHETHGSRSKDQRPG